MSRRIPRFVVCVRCGTRKELRRPSDQRTYCSHRCAGLVLQNIRQAQAAGVAISARNRKRRLLERVEGLTPLAAFRLGYLTGLQSKHRQIRKHRAKRQRAAA